MSKEELMKYILTTPGNTNPAILSEKIDETVSEEGGGGAVDFATCKVEVTNNRGAALTTGTFAVFYPQIVDGALKCSLATSTRFNQLGDGETREFEVPVPYGNNGVIGVVHPANMPMTYATSDGIDIIATGNTTDYIRVNSGNQGAVRTLIMSIEAIEV